MKVFIQKKSGGREWLNVNSYQAADWFETLGYEVVSFQEVNDIVGLELETPVVGGIGNVKKALERLGKTPPSTFDIPECLNMYQFIGRKVWTTTLNDIHINEEKWPVFIKSLNEGKRFTGHIIRSFVDLIRTSGTPMDLPILASEVVKWNSEYRCFILNGEIIDIRRYAGSLDWYPDVERVRYMVETFGKEAPAAYSLDVGNMLDANGHFFHDALVEVNDGYSLGTYGLPAHMQVKMILARWKEMTK